MTASKNPLSQHWLREERTLRRIVEAAELTSADTVLEIGPGTGALTAYLSDRAGQVIAVEADGRLAGQLSQQVGADNVKVMHEDILELDFTSLPESYKVVANIPYHITSRLLRLLCQGGHAPTVAVLLVQKELAQRVVAEPGDMSLLSFSVQYFAHPRLLDTVSRELFDPVPDVDSAILYLTSRQESPFPADTHRLFRLVKAGFSQRRKKLANALSGGLGIHKSQAIAILEAADIAPDARAQELSLAKWQALYTAANQQGKL